jgi:hypothetical protein
VNWAETIMEPKGTPFFPISSGDNRNLIMQPGGPGLRENVGLHKENKFDGSVGCIVLLWDTASRSRQVDKLFAFLNNLSKERQYIPLIVL